MSLRHAFGWSDPRGVGMGVAAPWGSASTSNSDHMNKVWKLEKYAEMVGDTLVKIYLNEDDVIGEEFGDLLDKIGLLKIAPEGEVIKNVGIRISANDFYVLREPKF